MVVIRSESALVLVLLLLFACSCNNRRRSDHTSASISPDFHAVLDATDYSLKPTIDALSTTRESILKLLNSTDMWGKPDRADWPAAVRPCIKTFSEAADKIKAESQRLSTYKCPDAQCNDQLRTALHHLAEVEMRTRELSSVAFDAIAAEQNTHGYEPSFALLKLRSKLKRYRTPLLGEPLQIRQG